MTSVAPIAFGAVGAPAITQLGVPAPIMPAASPGFADVLTAGFKTMTAKVTAADDMVRRFALDDSIPVHQVTYALEEARLSVELAMQVRARLVEGYREMMNMQL